MDSTSSVLSPMRFTILGPRHRLLIFFQIFPGCSGLSGFHCETTESTYLARKSPVVFLLAQIRPGAALGRVDMCIYLLGLAMNPARASYLGENSRVAHQGGTKLQAQFWLQEEITFNLDRLISHG